MQWFLYFLYYVQAAQPILSIKIQASSMIVNTIVLTFQFTGAHIQVHEMSHLQYNNNDYYWCIINTIDGNWWFDMCVCNTYSYRRHNSQLGYYDIYSVDADNALDYDLWTYRYCFALIVIIYFTLGKVILNLSVTKGHTKC